MVRRQKPELVSCQDEQEQRQQSRHYLSVLRSDVRLELVKKCFNEDFNTVLHSGWNQLLPAGCGKDNKENNKCSQPCCKNGVHVDLHP